MSLPAANTTGTFNYMSPLATSSLRRNGKVLTRRDVDGSDAGDTGIDIEKQNKPILDARNADEAFNIERHGFELLDHPLDDASIDFQQHEQVIQHYYPQCIQLVQSATGASHVYAFDHNVRSASGAKRKQRIAGGQQVQGPAHLVHGDYTLTSAPQRLRDLASPPTQNDTYASLVKEGDSLIPPEAAEAALNSGRFAIINVWRNIADEPLVTRPLALCNSQTVSPNELVVFEIHYADRIGENYFAKHADQHQWFYYPSMTKHEALLIKQWDSAGELAKSAGERADHQSDDNNAPCSFSFHSAFKDPATPPDAPDRWSIEVRCMVLY